MLNKVLSTIEEELSWLIKDYKATTDHSNSKHINVLNYQFNLDKKKSKLIFRFSFMKSASYLSLNIIYQLRDANRAVQQYEFPLGRINDGLDLPMIDAYDCGRISDIMDFEVVDGQLHSSVSPLTQGVTYTEVIRRNIKQLVKYAQQLSKHNQ